MTKKYHNTVEKSMENEDLTNPNPESEAVTDQEVDSFMDGIMSKVKVSREKSTRLRCLELAVELYKPLVNVSAGRDGAIVPLASNFYEFVESGLIPD